MNNRDIESTKGNKTQDRFAGKGTRVLKSSVRAEDRVWRAPPSPGQTLWGSDRHYSQSWSLKARIQKRFALLPRLFSKATEITSRVSKGVSLVDFVVALFICY